MTAPLRIRLSRAAGFRMPADTVKVDRSTPFGNPFVVGRHGDQAYVVELYARALDGYVPVVEGVSLDRVHAARLAIIRSWRDLAGRHLACWCRLCERHKAGKPLGQTCPDCAPCHADVVGRTVAAMAAHDAGLPA